VEIKVAGEHLEVKGPKGQLRERLHPAVKIEIKDGVLTVLKIARRRATTRARAGAQLAANMIQGVTEGFQKVLEIVGSATRRRSRAGC